MSGILVEPGDYQRLSESIVSLLKDPQIGAAMGQSGRQRAEKEFTWGSVVSRYEATFRGLSEEANQDALPIFDL